jgi:hypothetical protein
VNQLISINHIPRRIVSHYYILGEDEEDIKEKTKKKKKKVNLLFFVPRAVPVALLILFL